MLAPERLRPDNFTPLTRTPWAGRRLLARYKPGLRWPEPVGESWEISVEPSFPSRLERDGRPLRDVLAVDPEGWLGRRVCERYGRQSPLLVKLLDSAENLSVQVHPADDDPALAPHEAGKPESWYVLDADPGAGLYLGFREGVDRAEAERCLRLEGPFNHLLNFVPVSAGDSFVISPGTVHAIGAGVTLVEPQHVAPGRSGVTYRFWDWNRRYDADGRPCPDGRPRPLHVERSLAVTDWAAPRGAAFVEACRSAPRRLDDARLLVLDTPHFAAELWHGDGAFRIRADTMLGVTCLDGEVRLATDGGEITLGPGHSAVVPAMRVGVALRSGRAMACWSAPGAPGGPLRSD
jgi:mannose-6-phosphate isomerase